MESRIQKVFQEVLEDEDFILDRGLKRQDVEGWDSLAHIELVSRRAPLMSRRLRSASTPSMPKTTRSP